MEISLAQRCETNSLVVRLVRVGEQRRFAAKWLRNTSRSAMFTVFAFFAMLSMVCAAQAQSLREAVLMALSDYPAVLAAQASTQAAQSDIDRAFSQHWPQVGWQGTQSTYSDVTPNPFEPGNTWIQSPTVSLNIWSGWRIQSEVEQAEALAKASDQQKAITLNEVALLMAETYLNWARLGDLVRLSKANVSAHRRIAADIDTIVKIDPGRRIDAQQARVRLENATLFLEQRQTELAVLEARLDRLLLGNRPTQPSGVNEPIGQIPATSKDAMAYISDQHPAVAEQLAQVKAAEAQIRNARSQYSPTVDLTYGKQVNQGSGQGDYVTQISVNMPIFTGGSTNAAMSGAKAQLQAAQFRLQETRLTQRERLISAWSEWLSAKQRQRLGQRQSEQGQQLVAGYEKQFRVGRRSLLDLLNIQNELYNYQTSAVNALFDERIARMRILAAMGRLASVFKQGS